MLSNSGITSTLPTPHSLYFADINNQLVLFVGTGAGIFESPDLGTTWQNRTYNLISTEVTSIEYADSNLYATTCGDGSLEWPDFVAIPRLLVTNSTPRILLLS